MNQLSFKEQLENLEKLKEEKPDIFEEARIERMQEERESRAYFNRLNGDDY